MGAKTDSNVVLICGGHNHPLGPFESLDLAIVSKSLNVVNSRCVVLKQIISISPKSKFISIYNLTISEPDENQKCFKKLLKITIALILEEFMKLENKIAIVTGASSGMGEIAALCPQRALGGGKELDRLEELAKETKDCAGDYPI